MTSFQTSGNVDRDFRGWIVTVEQADAIAAGDRKALERFYIDNYARLEGMARKYAMRKYNQRNDERYNVSDMMGNLYIDLPNLNWQNARTLTCDIMHDSFHWSASGGYTLRKEQGLPVYGHVTKPDGKRTSVWNAALVDVNYNSLSLDIPVEGTNEDHTYADILQAPREYEVDFTPDDYGMSATALVELLSDFFSLREREALKAMLEGQRGKMLGETMKLSMKAAATNVTQVKRKLILHFEEVLSRLQTNGVIIPVYLLHIVPDDYERIKAEEEARAAKRRERQKNRDRRNDKRTPEQRHAEYLRRKERQRIAREVAQATAAQTGVTSGSA